MTDERFNYLMAEAKPIMDAIKEFAEKNNIGLFTFTHYSTGRIAIDVMEDIDDKQFLTYTAVCENGNIEVSKRTITREA